MTESSLKGPLGGLLEQPSSTIDPGAIRNLLNGLILLQSHLRLYGPNNANVNLTSERLLGFLGKLFAGEELVTIYVARHAFMFADGLIDRNNSNFEKFAASLFAHGIATLNLHREVTGNELQLFLQLVSRKPAETWDEGGMAHCLRARGIERISVREMAEQDFLLTDTLPETPAEELQLQRSRLWENFALSLLHGLHLPDPDPQDPGQSAPARLAEQLNRSLADCPEADQQTFARDGSRFLISLKHEKVRIYRAAALHKLVTFVNSLSPNLRRLFLDHAFTLNLDADLADGFLQGLSDQALLDAFRNATGGKGYVPPVVLKLLGRLAQERGFADPAEVAVGTVDSDAVSGKITELFKADDFDKYVPKAYQGALLAIIHKEALPVATTNSLERLKATLEPGNVEEHLGAIIFDILHQAPDGQHLEGFCSNLLGTLRFCLTTRNYLQIDKLYGRCRGGQVGEEVRHKVENFLVSAEFTAAALNDLQRLGQEQAEALWGLILSVPAPFVEPLLERLGTEANRSARLGYLKGLIRLGSACLAPATARLADPRWFVVRNMLYLLRELGDDAALPEIRKCLSHSHPKVQLEALRSCLILRDEHATPFLLQALAAKSPAELVSAINLASLSHHPQVIAELVDLLQSGTLLDYRLEVKKAAVRALASNAQSHCLPVFAELLGARNLLHARNHDQLKLEIIAVLANFPVRAAKALLQPQARSSSTDISRAAQLALNKLAGASP